jgi:tryptophan synthase alpha chain
MSRIEKTFQTLRDRNEAAFIAYLTAGDPDLARTEALVAALTEAGVDILEIGVPFSDPTADGPAIQAAAQRSLQAGTTLEAILEMIARIRRTNPIPVCLFGYYNPVFSYGNERFARDARAAGVDALLLVDLPPEEAGELRRFTDPAGLDFITLIAPTTGTRRLETVCRKASGFLYYISVTGVTGTAVPELRDIARDVARIRRYSDLPVAVGFGITTPDQAAAISPLADGIVMGSALVRLIEAHGRFEDPIPAAAAYAARIKEAIRRGRREHDAYCVSALASKSAPQP